MNTPRTYKDADGNPAPLIRLIKAEPAWAENQILHRDKLETELAEVKADYQKNDERWIAREFELLAEIGKLDAENDALLRGEYICKKCGIRKDGEGAKGDF